MTLPMAENDNDSGLLSIGALSAATGIPADTLRTWERRYGFPCPERTDSGHRRYTPRTARRLRRIQRALELGHAPSAVVGAEPGTVEALIREADAGAREAVETDAERAAALERWFERVEAFDGAGLEREMHGALVELGGQGFLATRAGAFVEALGARWESGQLGVRHEHFASERLENFLAAQWEPLSDRARGPVIVCATLPGERHVLGLHMAALALSLDDHRVLFLGHDTPPEEIAWAVERNDAPAVALSASGCVDPRRMEASVALLRALLPATTTIVGGGRGFRPAPPGVVGLASFQELRDWIRAR